MESRSGSGVGHHLSADAAITHLHPVGHLPLVRSWADHLARFGVCRCRRRVSVRNLGGTRRAANSDGSLPHPGPPSGLLGAGLRQNSSRFRHYSAAMARQPARLYTGVLCLNVSTLRTLMSTLDTGSRFFQISMNDDPSNEPVYVIIIGTILLK